MTTTPQFTLAEQERFAGVCACCANGVKAWKNDAGEYVHFADGRQSCLADRLRKSLEKKPLDRARDCWAAEQCPIEGNPKRAHKDWFCVGCWRKLPADIQSKLRWQNKGWIVQWIEAMAMLKQAKKKELTGTNG